jgi:DNA-binding NarL/FixJ family response regulator
MRNPRYSHRIVAVLCYCISDHAARLQRAGAGQVILKPLDLDELDRMIKSVFVAAS